MALIFMFSFLTLLLFNEIPDKNRDIVNILVTLLFPSLTGGILWYLYGYKRKDIDASDSSNSKVTTTITQKVEPKPVVE